MAWTTTTHSTTHPAAPATVRSTDAYSSIKRVIDLLGAASGIVLLGPLLLAIAAVVRCTSRGPALFRQERVGHLEQPFTCLKFRTMTVDNDDALHRQLVAEQLTGDALEQPAESFKLDHDPRVTRVGALLRRTSLDELPQLINVLRGEMSLVGPRPALRWEVELFEPRHRQRFLAMPGITGLWQVSGRSRLSFRQALDIDVEYVQRRSLLLDLSILVRTVAVVVRGDGAR